MALIALLFAYHGAVDGSEPWAVLAVGGLSVVERQARQARAAGATRVLVLAERMPPMLAVALERARDGVEVVRDAASIGARLAPSDEILVIEEGLVVDERAIAAVCSGPAPALAVWADPRPQAERIDLATHWAGLARLPAPLVREVIARLGDWDLQSTLLREAAGRGAARIDLGKLGDGCDKPLLWMLVRDEAAAVRSTDALIAAARVDQLRWPARMINPRVESALLRLLLPTRATPTHVTAAVATLRLLAGVAFAFGWLWLGLLLALAAVAAGDLDTALERLRHQESRWRDVKPVVNQTTEYLWYVGLGAHLASARGETGPLAVAVLLLLFAYADKVQDSSFRRMTGQHLDPPSGSVARFAGRRDLLLPLLVPFALLGTWYLGLTALAACAAASFFVMQRRVFERLAASSEHRQSTAPR